MEPRSVFPGCPGKQGQPFGKRRSQSYISKSDGYGMER